MHSKQVTDNQLALVQMALQPRVIGQVLQMLSLNFFKNLS